MAKKSKTQRAKASAARAAKKAQAREAEAKAVEEKDVAQADEAAPKGKLLSRFKKADKAEAAPAKPAAKKQPEPAKKAAAPEKPKKRRFAFLKDVRAEMKRVTWPTKKDVLRWSVVVVVALVFFGVYVAFLDNLIITPVLVAISGLGGMA